jgi:hypothetical protein
MAQAVRRLPLTAESRFRAWVNPCGIFGTKSVTVIGFSRSFSVFPVNIIPSSLSILIYHLGDEQFVRYWQQFRDVVTPHRSLQSTTQCCERGGKM